MESVSVTVLPQRFLSGCRSVCGFYMWGGRRLSLVCMRTLPPVFLCLLCHGSLCRLRLEMNTPSAAGGRSSTGVTTCSSHPPPSRRDTSPRFRNQRRAARVSTTPRPAHRATTFVLEPPGNRRTAHHTERTTTPITTPHTRTCAQTANRSRTTQHIGSAAAFSKRLPFGVRVLYVGR